MSFRFFFFLSVSLLGLAVIPKAYSQQSIQIEIANIKSDVNRLDQIVRALRLEVENLTRENRELKTLSMQQLNSNQQNFVTLQQLNSTLATFEKQISAANTMSQKQVIAEVSKEIESLAEQTQKAINALAKTVDTQPQLEQVITFNDKYPKAGTTYTVKRGDSLGKIARQLNSSVDWIRNANRLASDIIYPGQELFIPQKD